jgi:hypothetical protein
MANSRIKIMKIPCEGCLLIPVCRHKAYSFLMLDCLLLSQSMYTNGVVDSNFRKPEWEELIFSLRDLIKPTKWGIEEMVGWYSTWGEPKHSIHPYPSSSQKIRIRGIP